MQLLISCTSRLVSASPLWTVLTIECSMFNWQKRRSLYICTVVLEPAYVNTECRASWHDLILPDEVSDEGAIVQCAPCAEFYLPFAVGLLPNSGWNFICTFACGQPTVVLCYCKRLGSIDGCSDIGKPVTLPLDTNRCINRLKEAIHCTWCDFNSYEPIALSSGVKR